MNSVLIAMWGVLGVDLPKQNRSFGKVPGLLLQDVLLIIGLALGLLIILGLGVYFWMRPGRRRRKHVDGGEKVYRGAQTDGDGDLEEEESSQHESHSHGEQHQHGRRRYKYRVRRRTHRSRNPTLSETGGLPPVKSQETSNP